ncbi:hypothetical protein Agub_g2265 [Astrephomene gubernaculifera]|uniref:Uncharacterized protein n=1 Tax=Astrephomene gubernaculifera TaxID=47775 RepID=A0AAD3HHJ2_9CHLO|nr:hypothetical protein Agub_g2265 [Astrephomene gubernaculifera]
MNWGPRSETTSSGNPWWRKTLSRYSWAKSSAVTSSVVGATRHIFVRRSTKVTMVSYPAVVFGRCVMKSIDTLPHAAVGMGNGCSNPAGFSCGGLFRWHSSHAETWRPTSTVIPGHQNSLRQSSKVRVIPRCPA